MYISTLHLSALSVYYQFKLLNVTLHTNDFTGQENIKLRQFLLMSQYTIQIEMNCHTT